MSGEAGGVIVGGAIALVVAPVVITGAAALGLAYGAVKMGGYLGRYALDYASERKREKELVVEQCSVQMDSLYSQMRAVVRDEINAHAKCAERMAEQFHKIGADLKYICDAHPSAEELDRRIADYRSTVQSELAENYAGIREHILEEGQERLAQCIELIDKSNAEKAEIVRWADKSTAAAAMQKAAAAEMVRDAEASCRVLESMAEASHDISFRKQVQSVCHALERTRTMMEEAMYQGAFSNARTIVRESAILASEHVRSEMEMDMLMMEFRTKVEGLREEMIARRFIRFCDETKRNKKTVKVDLNHFSQGKYKHMLESLQEVIDTLDEGASYAVPYEVMRQMERFEKETEPEARRIMEVSQKIMTGYYDRVHVLEVVADFMTEQDYKMDWAMPVGGDASQKLVVHFVQKITGNTISVTLDNDAGSGDIANMAMEILTFYGNGRPVTEAEKKELRDHLNAALHKAGLGGTLGCQGSVNEASQKVEMDRKESVQNMPVRSIV